MTRKARKACLASQTHLPITEKQLQALQKPQLRKIGKWIEASEDEVKLNPRARSARLRIAEKIL